MTTAATTRAAAAAAGSRTTRRIVTLTTVLALIAVALALTAQHVGEPVETPNLLAVCGLFIALTVSGLVNLEYHYRGQTDAFDHFEVALIPALYVLPPVLVVGLACAAKLICQVYRRVSPMKSAFNVAQWGAAAAVGALVVASLGTDHSTGANLAVLTVATVAVMAVNTAALLLVMSALQAGSGRLRAPARTGLLLRTTIGTGAINLTFGLLFVATAIATPEAAPLLLLPLALLHWASRAHAVDRVEQARLRTTRSAIVALSATVELDAALAAFLAAVGAGLDRDGVDLLIATPESVATYRWKDGVAAAAPEAVGRDELSPLERTLLELTQPARADQSHGEVALRRLLDEAGWRDCSAAPFVAGDTHGALVLHGSRSPVARPELELALVAELAREVGLAHERAGLLRAVLDERSKMSQIVNESGDGIVTIDVDGTIRTWNPALERITGYAATDVVDLAPMDILHPVDNAGRVLSFSGWTTATQDPPPDMRIRTKGDSRRWLSCSYARSTDDSQADNRLIVIARDVTELKYAEGRLAGQTAVLEAIASSQPVHVSLQALADDLVRIDDDVACAVLLMSPTEPSRLEGSSLAGITMGVLLDLNAMRVGEDAGWTGRAVAQRQAIFVDDVENDPGSAHVRVAARLHGIRSCSAMPIRAPDGDRIMGVLALFCKRPRENAELRHRDLLERAAHLAAEAVGRNDFESRLAFQATHDALTQLPNRTLCLERTERALAQCRDNEATVLLFLDLDRFKLVNDSMGHVAGDQLLVEIAERLRRVVRPEDTVARFGGDEFTILCEKITDTGFVLDLAQRVQNVFARPFRLSGNDVVVTASLGVAVGGSDVGADELVNESDAAMYRAKERGGNRYELFDASMRGPGLLHLLTHNALHQALDRGELVVLYQPIVSLETTETVGVEALLRWNHPERGLLPPDAFLPLAESTGLIVPIGAYVVSTACAQAQRWRHSGPAGTPIRMNINLSARELGQPGLLRTIANSLANSGVDPATICFEITESALLYDVDATTATLRQMKDLGVELAIDDFGTGYSALTHLRRFPVDGLKVDRSFVSGLGEDGGDRAIVTAVIGLAHSLNLSTIGEGIESVTQLEALRDMGCHAGQGYYFGGPGRAEDVLPDPRRS